MTKRKSLLSIIFILIVAIMLPLGLMAALPTNMLVKASSFDGEHRESVTITNSSFDATSSSYTDGDFSGWTRNWGNTSAKTMAIDVQSDFERYSANTYYLKSNPGKVGSDNKILMINSANTNPNSDNFAPKEISEGYISNSISLSANSYYEFSVAMKTTSFSESNNTFGSIYISGLIDENDQAVDVQIEAETATDWTVYYFYIATGSQDQAVQVELWLGTNQRPSTGVVFFDEVCAQQLSENAYYKNIQLNQQSGVDCVVAGDINDATIIDTSSLNFDFEKSLDGVVNNLVDWKVDSTGVNGYAQILPLNQGIFESTTNFTYPGSDFSANNTQALALWAEDGFVKVESLPLEIKSLGLYKITFNVKISEITQGEFTISLNETDDIKNQFSYLSSYTLGSKTSSAITANGSDKFINEYAQVEFYVQGHDRYDSQIQIAFNLGSSQNYASGAVVIDNIIVEVVDSENFSTEGNVLQLATATASETTFKNGYFNSAKNQTNTLDKPVAPADWTITQPDNAGVKKAGIINVYSKYFDEYDYDWSENLANPGSPDEYSSTDDVNNILMLYNENANYQSISSSTFELTANTYYTLTFKYKTLADAWFNLQITDSNSIQLLNQQNIASGEWKTYQCQIFTGEGASTASLTIEFGNQDNLVSGYAFFDNFIISESSEQAFENAEVQIDLSGFMLNLDANNQIGNNITSFNAFTGKIDSGNSNSAKGGVIKGAGNDAFEYVNSNGEILPIDDGSLTKNVLAIQTDLPATYTLTSNFPVAAKAETQYYALTFRLLTSFPSFDGVHMHDDEEVDTTFGVSIGISGFDKVEGLKASDGWQEFTILFSVTQDSDASFTFSLISDCLDTTGYAFLTDIAWNTSDAETYNQANRQEAFGSTLFTATATAATEDDDDSATDDTTTQPEDGNNDETLWLLIPSIILALALIFAIVAFALRHVKIKKSAKVEKQKYDRDESLHADIITNQAKEIQNAEIAKIDEHIASIKAQIAEIEEDNKQTIAKAREHGKVTGAVEKQFKTFASKRAALQKSVDQLEEHKAFVQTKDYLISIEKRILASKKKQAKQTKQPKQ